MKNNNLNNELNILLEYYVTKIYNDTRLRQIVKELQVINTIKQPEPMPTNLHKNNNNNNLLSNLFIYNKTLYNDNIKDWDYFVKDFFNFENQHTKYDKEIYKFYKLIKSNKIENIENLSAYELYLQYLSNKKESLINSKFANDSKIKEIDKNITKTKNCYNAYLEKQKENKKNILNYTSKMEEKKVLLEHFVSIIETHLSKILTNKNEIINNKKNNVQNFVMEIMEKDYINLIKEFDNCQKTSTNKNSIKSFYNLNNIKFLIKQSIVNEQQNSSTKAM